MSSALLLLGPRLDLGFAPIIDGWGLQRRIAEARRDEVKPRTLATRMVRDSPAQRAARRNSRGLFPSGLAQRVRDLDIRALRHPRVEPTSASRRLGVLERRAVVFAAKGAVIITLAAATTPPLMAVLRYGAVRDTYSQAIENRTAVSVHVGPAVVGVVSRGGRSDVELSLPSHVRADDELYEMYDAVEGAGHRFSYFGIPVRSVVRAAACHAGIPVPGDCRGASGGIQHAVRGVRGGHGGDGSVMRSLREFILDGPALSVLYPEGDARAALILDNSAYGYLPGGRPIIGVANASRTVFGEPDPRRLSLAKKAVLIALIKRPLSWDNGAGVNVEGRGKLRRRATTMLVEAYGADDARVLAARRELARTDLLPARPVAPVLPLGGPVAREVRRELAELPEPPAQLKAIELTLSSEQAQATYEMDFRTTLAAMERRQRFDRPLLSGDERADSLAFNTGSDGAIDMITATSPRIDPWSRRRAGSHGKWVALLALARSERIGAESMLCNRARPGVQNPGGDLGVADCGEDGGLKSVEAVFRESSNLPLLAALDRISDAELRAAMAATGFDSPADGVDPRRALVLGTAIADAASIVALGDALESFANGGPAIGHYPYIVSRVRVDGRWVAPERRVLDLRSFLQGETARRLVRAACPAPLQGGTMKGLPESTRAGGLWCAKSATVAGPEEAGFRTISKAWTAASPLGNWYVYIGAPKGYLGPSELTILPAGKVAQERLLRR